MHRKLAYVYIQIFYLHKVIALGGQGGLKNGPETEFLLFIIFLTNNKQCFGGLLVPLKKKIFYHHRRRVLVKTSQFPKQGESCYISFSMEVLSVPVASSCRRGRFVAGYTSIGFPSVCQYVYPSALNTVKQEVFAKNSYAAPPTRNLGNFRVVKLLTPQICKVCVAWSLFSCSTGQYMMSNTA